jgi:hypothetical protein
MITFIVFCVGLFIGYWLYLFNMTWKLYKIQKKLVAIELEHMKVMEDLKGKQWNEDNL